MKDVLPEMLSDTDPAVEKLRLSLIKTLTPEEKFLRMCRLYTFGKLAALEGLKEKHPELNDAELVCLLAKNLHGEKFANHIKKKFYPELP